MLARAAATGDDEREQQEDGTSHFTAFERTAPVAVARTSTPGCGPGQTFAPTVVAIERFEPTWSTSAVTVAALPASS